MNKITENECLPNFELKLKFLENLRKPLTLKSTRKCIEEKNKMAEMREESQTTVLAEENQTSIAKENQTGINAEKSQASIPENQTIVTYTDDELVSFTDLTWFQKTLKKVLVHPYTVCSLGSRKNTANKLISMQFQSKKHHSFSSTSF